MYYSQKTILEILQILVERGFFCHFLKYIFNLKLNENVSKYLYAVIFAHSLP